MWPAVLFFRRDVYVRKEYQLPSPSPDAVRGCHDGGPGPGTQLHQADGTAQRRLPDPRHVPHHLFAVRWGLTPGLMAGFTFGPLAAHF